jgi:cupin superfamily acireductone dioxygenase involved in methionine salvage
MATIFTINNNNELESFRQITTLPFDHEDNLFSVEHKNSWSPYEIKTLKNKNAGHDIISIERCYQTEPHWHYGAEERLILSGKGRFFIPTAKAMYVIDVESGDLIWLSPCLQHWFETSSIMSARFFAEDNSHIEHKNNLSDEVISWSQRYQNGFKPEL